MSDSYCKGCRDEPGGCERCNPAREERERQQKRTEAEQRVLDAMNNVTIVTGMGDGAPCTPFMTGPGEAEACRAELARRGLK